MQSSPLLEHLIENLRCLPGVGPKSAQRMAYHLLQRNRSGGMNLARALTEAMSKIGHCSQCRDFTQEENDSKTKQTLWKVIDLGIDQKKKLSNTASVKEQIQILEALKSKIK